MLYLPRRSHQKCARFIFEYSMINSNVYNTLLSHITNSRARNYNNKQFRLFFNAKKLHKSCREVKKFLLLNFIQYEYHLLKYHPFKEISRTFFLKWYYLLKYWPFKEASRAVYLIWYYYFWPWKSLKYYKRYQEISTTFAAFYPLAAHIWGLPTLSPHHAPHQKVTTLVRKSQFELREQLLLDTQSLWRHWHCQSRCWKEQYYFSTR